MNRTIFEKVLGKGSGKGLSMSWSIQESGSMAMAQELVTRQA